MSRAILFASLFGLAAGSGFSDYLASMKDKHYKQFKWQDACKSLKQTPSGYGMSMGGGVAVFSLTCNSNHIKVKCNMAGLTMKKCTSTYHPPATAADTPPKGKYAKKASSSGCGGHGACMTDKEVQEILDIQNKMRCATGAEPMEWDEDLQDQAQKSQNKIGAFEHSKCYTLPIKAGENLATGTGVANAAWMWFLEYLNTDDYEHGHDTGHFTAMTWKDVKKVGCGIQRSGKGVIRCQYASGDGTPPNMKGDYKKNVPAFYGKKSQLSDCGLPIADVKGQAEMEKKWGILHPKGAMAKNIGLYSVSESLWSSASPTFFLTACALLGAVAMAVVIHRIRRRRATAQDLELLPCDEGLE